MPDAQTIAIRIASQGTQQFIRDLNAVGIAGAETIRSFLDSGKAAGEGFDALGAGAKRQIGSVSALAREAEKLRQAYEPQTDLLTRLGRLGDMVTSGLIKETTARQAAAAAIEKTTGAKARENAALEAEIQLRQRAEQLRDVVNPSRVQDRQIETARVEVNDLARNGYLQEAEALAILRTRIEEITGARARDAIEVAKQAAATERLTNEANQLKAALDPQFRLQQELNRIEQLRTAGALKNVEATNLVNATVERSTGAKAKEKAATDALAQSAERLRLALDPQYALSKRIAEIDDLVAKKHLDVATAAKARAAAEAQVNGQLQQGHGRAAGFAFQNVGFQIQDIATQLAAGTSPILTLSQQLPQLASGFGLVGVAIGTVLGVAGAIAVKFLDLSSASDKAKESSEAFGTAQKNVTSLLGDLGEGVDALIARYNQLSDVQQGVAGRSLEEQARKAKESLNAQNVALAESVELLERRREDLASVVNAPAVQNLPVNPQALASLEGLTKITEIAKQIREGTAEAGAGNEINNLIEQYFGAGKASAMLRDNVNVLTQAVLEAKEAYDLASASLSVTTGVISDQDAQIINSAKIRREATAAITSYADGIAKLREKHAAGANEEERAVIAAKEQLGIRKQQAAVDLLKPGPERDRAQADVNRRAAEIERLVREQEQAERAASLAQKREAINRRLTASEKELTGAVDERTRAGDRGAAAIRAQEGATEEQIERGRRNAIAEFDQAKAIQASNKAKTDSGQQTAFLQRKEQEADAAKRETEAIRGTAKETEHALRYLKIENEYRNAGLNVQDASIKKRIEENVVRLETIDSLKAEQKAREAVASAQKLQGRFEAGLGNAPATDVVTKAAIETANELAKARGDAAISFEEVRRLIGVYSQYEESLKDVSKSEFREAQLALNIALHKQGEAGDRAAKGLDNLAAARLGLKQERELTEALKQGLAAYKQRKIAIEVENDLKEKGVGLSIEDREELRKTLTEREQLDEANAESIKQIEESAERMAEVFQQPFKDLTSTISSVASDTVLEFEQSGTLSGKAFAERFTEGIQKIGANLIGALTTAPINAAIASLTSSLTAAMNGAAGPTSTGPRALLPPNLLPPGAVGAAVGAAGIAGAGAGAAASGGGFLAQLSAVGQWASANALNAGIAGGAAGGLVGSLGGAALGKPGSYAGTGGSIGGAAGAAIGTYFAPGIGTIIGGALGSVGGSLFGSMFGGGDDQSGDNNMRQRFRPGQGVYYRESVQEGGEQNAQVVNQFMDQLMKAGKIFEQAGLVVNENFGAGIDLKVGSNSGITLDGKKYTSIEDALGAALQQLGKRGYRAEGENIMEQIARNTKATTAEGLAADFAFGKEYPRLIKGGGDLGRSIDEVAERFEALKDKAAELGLSVSKLDAVQDEQIHAMKEEARARIGILTGESSEYRQALLELGATFEAAKKDAVDLEMSTEKLNAARDKERERLKAEANIRIDMLSGKGGDYLQAQIDLNAKYDEAKRIAIDLGRSTDDLNKARDRERDQLQDTAEQGVRRLTGDFGSLDEAMLNLNKTYNEAKLLANQLGISTEKLNRVRDEERERVRASANADLQVMIGEWSPLAQQLLQLRDAFHAANENARDLGISEERLVEARKRAEAELIQNSLTQAKEALQGQADQFRSFFTSVLDPLKQAQSAFGGLQGIASPQASLAAGLSEFRETFARAKTSDDLSAVQALPGLGQSLIQFARQYGASGAPANEVIREVQKAYSEMEVRYRDRQINAMESLGEIQIRTGADTIRTLSDGFKTLKTQLESLERTVRATKLGLAA